VIKSILVRQEMYFIPVEFACTVGATIPNCSQEDSTEKNKDNEEETEVLRTHVQTWKLNLYAQFSAKFTIANPTRGRFDTRGYRAMFKALDCAERNKNKMPELVTCYSKPAPNQVRRST
jgi:hypothetical protein